MAYSRYQSRPTTSTKRTAPSYARRTAPATAPVAIKAAFPPSPHQQAVLNWVQTGQGSANVIAVAGAGKTSTILLIVPVIPEDQEVLLVAFGKKIALELEARLNLLRQATGRAFANVKVTTAHSYGFGVLCRSKFNGRRARVDGRKLTNLAAQKFTGEDYEIYGDFAAQLVNFAKGEGIGAITADSEQAWFNLVYHHDIILDGEGDERRGVELARQLLRWSNEQAERDAVIDFADQLYLPLLWKCRFNQYDFILADEAQDTNLVRRAIFRLSLKSRTGRLIAFGDPRQAIFGFTGASHDSLDQIKADFHSIELPLTVSFRCSQAVVAYAKEIVPYIEASSTAPIGAVLELAEGDVARTLTGQDAIVCRNTAPLVEMAYKLIARGIPCHILGREIGTGLVRLIRTQKADDLIDLDHKLQEYLDRETTKYLARGEDRKVDVVTDRVNCIRNISDNLPAGATVADLCKKLETMFDDDDKKPILTLSTIHKAKGLEYPKVALLRPELIPSKWARLPHQLKEEENLDYVARTRAQDTFYLVQTGAPATKAA
jgi:DNA helicase-2/ATP-dependent DNA helicase PcrA